MSPFYHLDLVTAIHGFPYTGSKPSDFNATLVKYGSHSVQSSHEYHVNGRIVLDSAVIFQLTTRIMYLTHDSRVKELQDKFEDILRSRAVNDSINESAGTQEMTLEQANYES